MITIFIYRAPSKIQFTKFFTRQLFKQNKTCIHQNWTEVVEVYRLFKENKDSSKIKKWSSINVCLQEGTWKNSLSRRRADHSSTCFILITAALVLSTALLCNIILIKQNWAHLLRWIALAGVRGINKMFPHCWLEYDK